MRRGVDQSGRSGPSARVCCGSLVSVSFFAWGGAGFPRIGVWSGYWQTFLIWANRLGVWLGRLGYRLESRCAGVVSLVCGELYLLAVYLEVA